VAAELVPLVLNGALLAAEALPRGGVVTGSGSARDMVFLPEGRNAAWPAETLAVLTGRSADPLAAGPRHVVAPLLLGLAAAQDFECSLMPGMGPGLPALMLTRR
jgi:histidine phosphotransferase ChpT